MITATSNLEDVINYSNIYMLAVPTKVVRDVLISMNKLIKSKVYSLMSLKELNLTH